VNCRGTREIGGDPLVLNLGIEPFSPFLNSKDRTLRGQRNGPILWLLQSHRFCYFRAVFPVLARLGRQGTESGYPETSLEEVGRIDALNSARGFANSHPRSGQIKGAESIPAQILSATIHSQHGQMLDA